jgi:hypothetical protein
VQVDATVAKFRAEGDQVQDQAAEPVQPVTFWVSTGVLLEMELKFTGVSEEG